jgi:ZIP Zinc transporter
LKTLLRLRLTWCIMHVVYILAGVVISTAFVHMIPEAMAALNNPCLGSIGNAYAPFPLVIVMGTTFAMQLMEFFLTRKMMASAESSWKAAAAAEAEAEKPATPPALAATAVSGVDTEAGTLAAMPLHSPTSNTPEQQHQLAETSDCDCCPRPAQVHTDHAGCAHHSMEHLKEFDVAESRGFIGLVIFELGIAFHSVFVGIALGVISGKISIRCCIAYTLTYLHVVNLALQHYSLPSTHLTMNT